MTTLMTGPLLDLIEYCRQRKLARMNKSEASVL
jgi:hypothetical protein